jgi:hypothetical protein
MLSLPPATSTPQGIIPPLASRRHIHLPLPLLSPFKNSIRNLKARMAHRHQPLQLGQLARLARVSVPSRIVKHSARSANVETSAFYHAAYSLSSFHVFDITPSTNRHVKALESRSQLLDAALASADEANRRWEECRALVDQLRIENAALRAALSQAQMMGSGGSSVPAQSGSDENRSAAAPTEGTKGAEEPKE